MRQGSSRQRARYTHLSGTIAEEASCHTAHEAAHESRSEQQTKTALPRAWPHDKDKDGSREHRDGDRPWSTALRPHRLSSGTAASALTSTQTLSQAGWCLRSTARAHQHGHSQFTERLWAKACCKKGSCQADVATPNSCKQSCRATAGSDCGRRATPPRRPLAAITRSSGSVTLSLHHHHSRSVSTHPAKNRPGSRGRGPAVYRPRCSLAASRPSRQS